MAEELTVYQCPNCNAPLHFDAKDQKLKCDNCGSTYTTQQIDDCYMPHDESPVPQEDISIPVWDENEKNMLQAFDCPACGAQLIADITTGATSCPYCGNNAVVPSQFSNSYRPDYIIPFQLEKKDAVERLQEFYKKMPFLPDAFKDENHIEEIKGVYVPFWLYDSNVKGHIRAHCTRTHSHTEGEYQVTTTTHYLVVRDGRLTFEKVPADASSHMPDEFMDSIEPYDFSKLVPFEMGYLPGYMADRYDISHEEDESRVNVRMNNTMLDQLHSTIIGYSGVMTEDEHVDVLPGIVHYAFLPVWMLSTRYRDKTYIFAMNGQTGKMIGDTLPKDGMKMLRQFVIVLVVCLVISAAILYTLFMTGGN